MKFPNVYNSYTAYALSTENKTELLISPASKCQVYLKLSGALFQNSITKQSHAIHHQSLENRKQNNCFRNFRKD